MSSDETSSNGPSGILWAAVSGAAQSLLVTAGLVAFGVLGFLSTSAGSPHGAYPTGEMADEADEADGSDVWLVDGFNVLNAAILHGAERKGFWRSEARERLLDRAAGMAGEQSVCVVFDGEQPPESEPHAHLRVVFAPSADDWLLRQVRSAEEPARLVLVTADRSLADRARHAGARVVSPRDFLARCDASPRPEAPA